MTTSNDRGTDPSSLARHELWVVLGRSTEALDSADAADRNLPVLLPNEPSLGQYQAEIYHNAIAGGSYPA